MKERQERLADVKIKTSGPIAEVFIDGRKVPRVMAFQAEMNTMEKRIAQVTLRVQCNLDLETGIVQKQTINRNGTIVTVSNEKRPIWIIGF